MDAKVIAIILQESGHFITQLLRTRQRKVSVTSSEIDLDTYIQQESPPEPAAGEGEKATAIATGCIPCSLGHMGTCSGLLNEAMRFGRNEGVGSPEVIDRVNMCMDEISSLERVDLRPQMLAELPDWEKKMANSVLSESRNIRHRLEALESVEQLETLAAETQKIRQDIGRQWFKHRLAKMNPEEREQLTKKVKAKIAEGADENREA